MASLTVVTIFDAIVLLVCCEVLQTCTSHVPLVFDVCVCVNAVQQLNTAICIHPAGMAKLCTFHQFVI